MIGALVKACERGRRDAREGRRASWRESEAMAKGHRWCYWDGWRRERRAMAFRGELPQLTLPLQIASASRTEIPCEESAR